MCSVIFCRLIYIWKIKEKFDSADALHSTICLCIQGLLQSVYIHNDCTQSSKKWCFLTIKSKLYGHKMSITPNCIVSFSAELSEPCVHGICFYPIEHWGPGEDVREMLPAPSYRRQQQFPGQLLLLHLRNKGNQGAGHAFPGNTFETCMQDLHTHTSACMHTNPYIHRYVDA